MGGYQQMKIKTKEYRNCCHNQLLIIAQIQAADLGVLG
jgi:hypothetical protein